MNLKAGVALALIGLLGLAACAGKEQAHYTARDVSNVVASLQFKLTSEDGKPLGAAAFRGKVTLVYFGYTHCPDVCPATLAKVAHALKALGPQAAQVRMLFVSVDPKRDTPSVLKDYTDAFAPQIVGATGTQRQLIEITKRYRVAYRLGKADAQGDYPVYHSSAIFVFDGKGEARLLMTGAETETEMTADLRTLLTST